MSLYTENALNDFLNAEIESAADDHPLNEVKLISKYEAVDLRGNSKFLKVSIADWYETEGRGDEMVEHDCLFYLESFKRPVSDNLGDEKRALDDVIAVMQKVQRALLANTDLDGNICDLLADKFKFRAGMTKLGATRFAVCILPIILNPMEGR